MKSKQQHERSTERPVSYRTGKGFRDGLNLSGASMLPLAVLSSVLTEVRRNLGLSYAGLSRRTGVAESAIKWFERRDPGSLRLAQLAALLNGLHCRLEIHPVWNCEELEAPRVLARHGKQKAGAACRQLRECQQ